MKDHRTLWCSGRRIRASVRDSDASGPAPLTIAVREVPVQIAGNKCKICERGIILSSEGKFCPRCGTCAHLACEPRGECGVCGQSYQDFERPKAGPLSEAVVPPALRPAKSGGPVFAIFVGAVLLLLVILVAYALAHARGK